MKLRTLPQTGGEKGIRSDGERILGAIVALGEAVRREGGELNLDFDFLTAGSSARTMRFWICATPSTVALETLVVCMPLNGDPLGRRLTRSRSAGVGSDGMGWGAGENSERRLYMEISLSAVHLRAQDRKRKITT